jgi:hypothetical protein
MPIAREICPDFKRLCACSEKLLENSKELARTGSRDALGGTWINIQSLRSPVGDLALDALMHFTTSTLLPSSDKAFRSDQLLDPITSLLNAAGALLADESRALVSVDEPT